METWLAIRPLAAQESLPRRWPAGGFNEALAARYRGGSSRGGWPSKCRSPQLIAVAAKFRLADMLASGKDAQGTLPVAAKRGGVAMTDL